MNKFRQTARRAAMQARKHAQQHAQREPVRHFEAVKRLNKAELQAATSQIEATNPPLLAFSCEMAFEGAVKRSLQLDIAYSIPKSACRNQETFRDKDLADLQRVCQVYLENPELLLMLHSMFLQAQSGVLEPFDGTIQTKSVAGILAPLLAQTSALQAMLNQS